MRNKNMFGRNKNAECVVSPNVIKLLKSSDWHLWNPHEGNGTRELTASFAFGQWEVDQPCRPGSPSLLVRPFVPLRPEFHSITQRYNTTLACHGAHTAGLAAHAEAAHSTKGLLLCFEYTASQNFEHARFFFILTTFYTVDTHQRYQIYDPHKWINVAREKNKC